MLNRAGEDVQRIRGREQGQLHWKDSVSGRCIGFDKLLALNKSNKTTTIKKRPR